MTAPWRWVAGVLVVANVGLAAQSQRDQRTPARDRPVEIAGTASISGVVTTQDEANGPVRRASVMLASGPLVMPRTAVTDEQGRFEFTGLAAGNYTLVAQKPAWVPAIYGARSTSDTQGIPVAVADGQRIAGLRLRMMRGAVVAGVVRLASGQPAHEVVVQAMQVRTVDGRRVTSSVAGLGAADDLGAYRVFGLPPGDYIIQARSQPNLGQGRVIRQVTEAEVRWAEEQAAMTQAQAATTAVTTPPAGPAVTYSTVYFPGTTYASDAAVLSLPPGEERSNVDFSLSLVSTARVTGMVVRPDGTAAGGATVVLQPEGQEDGDLIGMMLGAGRAVSRPDGTFVLSGVTPGRYTLTVRGTPPPPAGAPPTTPQAAQMAEAMAMVSAMSGMFAGGSENPATLWATEAVSVDGQDIGPLTMQLRDGLTLEGTIVIDRGGVPADVTNLRVGLSAPSPTNSAMAMLQRMASGASVGVPADDGTFVVKGLIPGTYQVAVSGRPMRLNIAMPGMPPSSDGWVVKSVMWRDLDLADSGVEIRSDVPVAGVVVTLTNRPAELAGTVIDAAGRPTGAFPIVVFPRNPAQWGPGSRRVLQAHPASDGAFSVIGLPEGDYYLAAVTRLEPGDLANRRFLEDLVPASLPISIRDGEKKTQDLKLASGG